MLNESSEACVRPIWRSGDPPALEKLMLSVSRDSSAKCRSEVYIQPFPGGGEKKQVSTNGGQQPRWSPDGKELFYIGPDSGLMVVPLSGANSRLIEPGVPSELFATRIALAPQRTVRHQYAVSHDGKQFLINSFTKDAAISPITLILNWNPQEKK